MSKWLYRVVCSCSAGWRKGNFYPWPFSGKRGVGTNNATHDDREIVRTACTYKRTCHGGYIAVLCLRRTVDPSRNPLYWIRFFSNVFQYVCTFSDMILKTLTYIGIGSLNKEVLAYLLGDMLKLSPSFKVGKMHVLRREIQVLKM